MKTLCILNDPPYGTERSYNALRLAGALVKRPDQEVRVFLLGDAAAGSKRGQTTPQGYYNVGRMLQLVARGVRELHGCPRTFRNRPRGGYQKEYSRGTGRLGVLGGQSSSVLA